MRQTDWIVTAFGAIILALGGWTLAQVNDHGKILVHAEDEIKYLSSIVGDPETGLEKKVNWLYQHRNDKTERVQ